MRRMLLNGALSVALGAALALGGGALAHAEEAVPSAAAAHELAGATAQTAAYRVMVEVHNNVNDEVWNIPFTSEYGSSNFSLSPAEDLSEKIVDYRCEGLTWDAAGTKNYLYDENENSLWEASEEGAKTVVLYGQYRYEPVRTVVIHDTNDGTTQTLEKCSGLSLHSYLRDREGVSFVFWSLDKEGKQPVDDTTAYVGSTKLGTTINLYAQFARDQVAVRFHDMLDGSTWNETVLIYDGDYAADNGPFLMRYGADRHEGYFRQLLSWDEDGLDLVDEDAFGKRAWATSSSDEPFDVYVWYLSSKEYIQVSGEGNVIVKGQAKGESVPEGAEVLLSAIKTELTDEQRESVAGFGTPFAAYKVTLYVNGQAVHDGFGSLEISFPVGLAYEGRDATVTHFLDDGSSASVSAPVTNGYATIEVSDLSTFAVSVNTENETLYRLYNKYTGEHLYTADKGEYDGLVDIGWTGEGVAWIAPTTGEPVYRLFNPFSDDHHYTMSIDEYDKLEALGWRKEGVAWRSASKDATGAIPLHRLFNPYEMTATHLYTASEDEEEKLAGLGWVPEGIAWYGFAED